MIFELWHTKADNSLSYFARDADYATKRDLLGPNSELLWTYSAKSYFDAMRARNEHLGWNPYVPEADWEDEVYE